MRYYCKTCKSEMDTLAFLPGCPFCQKDYSKEFIEVPEFETVELYEKRTGTKLNGRSAVWVINQFQEEWLLYFYS